MKTIDIPNDNEDILKQVGISMYKGGGDTKPLDDNLLLTSHWYRKSKSSMYLCLLLFDSDVNVYYFFGGDCH
jgi:hypothetical protein|tara:strand:+ start:554 stop:769 length:216 start_codon:yes stop_codon:yes gene_type:complete